jgi:hypothetical protein
VIFNSPNANSIKGKSIKHRSDLLIIQMTIDRYFKALE